MIGGVTQINLFRMDVEPILYPIQSAGRKITKYVLIAIFLYLTAPREKPFSRKIKILPLEIWKVILTRRTLKTLREFKQYMAIVPLVCRAFHKVSCEVELHYLTQGALPPFNARHPIERAISYLSIRKEHLTFVNLLDFPLCQKLNLVTLFEKCKNISTLLLGSRLISNETIEELNCQNLKTLRIQDAVLTEFFWKNTGLEQLSLRNLFCLEKISFSTVQLKTLHLEHCLINDISFLSRMTRLESLSLCLLAVNKIPPVKKFCYLKELTIRHCPLIRKYPNLSGCSALEKLHLAYCDQVVTLPSLDHLIYLTSLTMLSDQINFSIPSLPNLKQIAMNDNAYGIDLYTAATCLAFCTTQ